MGCGDVPPVPLPDDDGHHAAWRGPEHRVISRKRGSSRSRTGAQGARRKQQGTPTTPPFPACVTLGCGETAQAYRHTRKREESEGTHLDVPARGGSVSVVRSRLTARL